MKTVSPTDRPSWSCSALVAYGPIVPSSSAEMSVCSKRQAAWVIDALHHGFCADGADAKELKLSGPLRAVCDVADNRLAALQARRRCPHDNPSIRAADTRSAVGILQPALGAPRRAFADDRRGLRASRKWRRNGSGNS
jgi:hypothetical protein